MEPLLVVRNLETSFFTKTGAVKAVDGVSFTIGRRETLGIVGESGCGKSVTSLSILGLLADSGRVTGGEVRLDGTDLLALSEQELSAVRGRRIAMIFQEPMTALNPVLRIEEQICEQIRRHEPTVSASAARGRAIELLDRVGIPAPAQRVRDYPHQLSGGMRQRAMIAMALSCRPELLIADEPTTALDVTIQAQILSLLQDLQDELGMAMQFITHDLGVISELADRVLVMYAGKVVEEAPSEELFARPRHPYTVGLLQAIPRMDQPTSGSLQTIEGSVPALHALPKGCRFQGRCPRTLAICCDFAPPLESVGEEHKLACFNPL